MMCVWWCENWATIYTDLSNLQNRAGMAHAGLIASKQAKKIKKKGNNQNDKKGKKDVDVKYEKREKTS